MQKYKECIMYFVLILVLIMFLFQQLKPRFDNFIRLFNELKTQKTVAESINKQLSVAKAKVERKEKLKLVGDVVKKIYEPTGAVVDTETSFSVLFDDIIEIARQDGIKTHSIEYEYSPEDDSFVKGASDKYLICRLKMKIVTDYADFEKFLQDLYRYNYLININSVEIYPYEKNKRVLLISLALTLYTMKDPSIVEEPKPAEEGENAGGEGDKKPEEPKAEAGAQPQTPEPPPGRVQP